MIRFTDFPTFKSGDRVIYVDPETVTAIEGKADTSGTTAVIHLYGGSSITCHRDVDILHDLLFPVKGGPEMGFQPNPPAP